MELFKHILITRFNVKINGYASTKRLDDKYLEERFDLFEKFCFPSVFEQSNNNFTWLLFFDINTQDKFKNRIESLFALKDNFKVIYVEDHENLLSEIQKFCLFQTSEWIISSRVDNDDSLSKDYIDVIQQNFNPKTQILNAENGLILNIKNSYLYSLHYKNSPFLSLIEKNDLLAKSLLKYPHNAAYKKVLVNDIKTEKPLWCQIIHQSNLANSVRGTSVSFLPYHWTFTRAIQDVIVKKEDNKSNFIFDFYLNLKESLHNFEVFIKTNLYKYKHYILS